MSATQTGRLATRGGSASKSLSHRLASFDCCPLLPSPASTPTPPTSHPPSLLSLLFQPSVSVTAHANRAVRSRGGSRTERLSGRNLQPPQVQEGNSEDSDNRGSSLVGREWAAAAAERLERTKWGFRQEQVSYLW